MANGSEGLAVDVGRDLAELEEGFADLTAGFREILAAAEARHAAEVAALRFEIVELEARLDERRRVAEPSGPTKPCADCSTLIPIDKRWLYCGDCSRRRNVARTRRWRQDQTPPKAGLDES